MGNEYGANRRYCVDVDRAVEIKVIGRAHHEYTFHRYKDKPGEPWRNAQGVALPPGEPFRDAEGNYLEPQPQEVN